MFHSTTKDDTITRLKDSADDVGAELYHVANQAGRKVRRLYTSAGDEIAHAGDHITDEIRLHPVRSTAIALGVGVLFGALLRR